MPKLITEDEGALFEWGHPPTSGHYRMTIKGSGHDKLVIIEQRIRDQWQLCSFPTVCDPLLFGLGQAVNRLVRAETYIDYVHEERKPKLRTIGMKKWKQESSK